MTTTTSALIQVGILVGLVTSVYIFLAGFFVGRGWFHEARRSKDARGKDSGTDPLDK